MLPSAAAVVLAVASVVIAWRSGGPAAPPGEDPSVQLAVAAAVEQAFAARDARPAVAATVYDTILPSLVVVQTERAPGAPAEVPEGDGEGEGRSGLGTGVVINDDGTVLTALHVVEGAVSVQLSFADGTRSDATVASTDPAHDIAVLTPATLPEVVVPAVLGGGLRVGDDVYAVGHPLGLVGSLSAGVVSATDRDVPISADRTLEGLIQFDAAVNPGNSGGPLLNRAGQVVGVVTALANPADVGFFVGIGFAVPIATAGGAAGGPSQ
ncbi:MAG: trypsin-like peptidase domain-containing protein [Acidimicrobiales bacterium]